MIEMENTPTFRRGEITGRQTSGPPITESTRWWKCEACGGFFDVFDLASAIEHDGRLPHPAGDLMQ